MDHLLSFWFSVWKNHTPNHNYTDANDDRGSDFDSDNDDNDNVLIEVDGDDESICGDKGNVNGDDDNGDVLIAMVMMMTMTTVLGNDVDEGNGAALQ